MGELIHLFGAPATCRRCDVPLVVAHERQATDHPAAIRFAIKPEGVCRACAVTQWIRLVWPLTGGPEITRDMIAAPHVQKSTERVLAAAGSDAEPTDWDAVVRHWDLPLEPPKTRRRRGR